MSLNVSLSFALQSHPCRECITNLVLVALGGDKRDAPAKVATMGAETLALPAGEAPFAPRDWRHSPLEPEPKEDATVVEILASKVRRRSWRWNCGVAVCICAASFLVAWLLDDLGTVFGIVGGTGSTALCYILPGGLYLRSETIKAAEAGLPRPWDCRRCGAAFMFGVGIVMVGVSNYAVFASVGNTKDADASPEDGAQWKEFSIGVLYNLF